MHSQVSQTHIARTHRHKCKARSHRHTLPEPTDTHCQNPQAQMHSQVPQTHIAKTHRHKWVKCIARLHRHKCIARPHKHTLPEPTVTDIHCQDPQTQIYALLGSTDTSCQNPPTYTSKAHRCKCTARSHGHTLPRPTNAQPGPTDTGALLGPTHRHIARTHSHTLPRPTDIHCQDQQTQMHY